MALGIVLNGANGQTYDDMRAALRLAGMTEAAAATAAGMGLTSAPQILEMRVDRPFGFAIRVRFSGTLLFVGVVNVVGE